MSCRWKKKKVVAELLEEETTSSLQGVAWSGKDREGTMRSDLVRMLFPTRLLSCLEWLFVERVPRVIESIHEPRNSSDTRTRLYRFYLLVQDKRIYVTWLQIIEIISKFLEKESVESLL